MSLTRRAALQELCDEVWPVIDQQVAEVLGLPQWKTPDGARRKASREFASGPRVSKYDPRKPADRCLLVQTFRDLAFPTAEVTARAVMYAVTYVEPRTLTAIRRKLRVKHLPKAQSKWPAGLRNADTRNLELLSFVVERIIPFDQLLEQRLDRHGKDARLLPGHRGPKVAVPRHALADEWNRAHPDWSMSSGDVLMGQFYRAAARPHLSGAFLHQVQSEFDEVWHGWEEECLQMARLMAGPDAVRGKEDSNTDAWIAATRRHADRHLKHGLKLEARMSRLPEVEQRALREAYRAKITRKELIAWRAFLVFWCPEDARYNAGPLILHAPLREWFLTEAYGGRGLFWALWPPYAWGLVPGMNALPGAELRPF